MWELGGRHCTIWKSHSVRRKSAHKNLGTHLKPVYADKQTHTRHTTKPPVLLGPAGRAVISKAACGAEPRCCGADQLQMCFCLTVLPTSGDLLCWIRSCSALQADLHHLESVLFHICAFCLPGRQSPSADTQDRRYDSEESRWGSLLEYLFSF